MGTISSTFRECVYGHCRSAFLYGLVGLLYVSPLQSYQRTPSMVWTGVFHGWAS